MKRIVASKESSRSLQRGIVHNMQLVFDGLEELYHTDREAYDAMDVDSVYRELIDAIPAAAKYVRGE